jgi:hypothetical protein
MMSTNLYYAFEARTHVAIRAAASLRAVDAEAALAFGHQGGSDRLASIRLHRRSFEQEIATLAAMRALCNP